MPYTIVVQVSVGVIWYLCRALVARLPFEGMTAKGLCFRYVGSGCRGSEFEAWGEELGFEVEGSQFRA